MELLKVTKDGSLHFKLSDGRIGVSYSSGYVRVSTKSTTTKNLRMYQINKQTFTDSEDNARGYTFVERELIPLQRDRLNHLMNFNNKNCK
jgi:hypothetical protein